MSTVHVTEPTAGEPQHQTPPRDDDAKDAERARSAFATGDVEASRREHALPVDHHHQGPLAERHSGSASDYVKSIVFGGLDGITTTFAIVSAAAGAGESWKIILIFGFANCIADAFSMGFGETVSGMAELDFARSERERENWEVENNKEGEVREMEELFEARGFSEVESKTLVDIFAKDNKRFVDVMMIEELGLLVNLEDPWVPLKQGLVMFTAFIAFGIFPLLCYLSGKGQGTDYMFGISCGVTAVGMLTLGGVKGYLTSISIPKSALIMLLQGSFSGGASYAVGVIVELIVNGGN